MGPGCGNERPKRFWTKVRLSHQLPCLILFMYDFIVSFDVNFLWVWGIILFPTEDDSGFGWFVDVLLGASNFLVCSKGCPILSHFSPEIIILFLNSLIDVVVELFCLGHTISSSCTVCWFKSKI